MEKFFKNIKKIDIEKELKRSYLGYAMSVIVERALPDVRDGLKPVHRRILYAMNVLKNDWNKPYKKSSRIVGDVIGKYHPHGDTAVYDAIVRMAQSFSLRYPLVDGQGNFGSVDGDCAAAMRYTEIRLSKISHEILSDLKKSTVNFVPNYDNNEIIPDVMPSKIPNLLINGSSGIAVGMATNIPSHNLFEIINGCLACIENEHISVKELMQHIPGPDFPTSAIIHGNQGIKDAYTTGKGKIQITSRVQIKKNKKNKNEKIIVHEIPYQVNKTKLIEKIIYLIKNKKIEGINSLRDESDKDGLRIVFEIKRGNNSRIVLNHLYSLTQLRVSFGINMVALRNSQPQLLSLKEIIFSFLEHRRHVIIKRTLFDFKKIRHRIHLLEALEVTHINIEKVIELIRKSSNTNSAKKKLVSCYWKIEKIFPILKNLNFSRLESEWKKKKLEKNRYFFSVYQAKSILSLRLHQLTGLEYQQLIVEHQKLLLERKKLKNILKYPKYLNRVLSRELTEIQKTYRDTRRTKILVRPSNFHTEDLIRKENVVVTLSYYGYVKYQPLNDYESQHRGGTGKSAVRTRERDFVCSLLVTNTHDTILLFSTRGRVYWLEVHQLPLASRNAKGKPIINMIPLQKKERITAILPIKKYQKNEHVFMATANGIVKKTPLVKFSRPRASGIIALHLNTGDQLVGVDFTSGKNDIMLFSSFGKVVRFSENQVRSMGRTAMGVRGISLFKNDKVVSLIVPQNKGTILTVTQNGYGKRTELSQYPVKSRAKKGVISIKINKRNGQVVGAIQVENSNQVMLITDQGSLVRIKVMEASIFSRNTQGVRLIRTSKKKYVVGIQRIIDSV